MWMNANVLKVNDDKTVALVHASRKDQMKHNITAIKIGDCDIIPSPSARNIGIVFDAEMSMAYHVHQTCRVCYYHLKNVASIRSCLTEQAAIRLVHSLVVSRLYYGNALLFGIPDVLIGKLQRVQKYAARLVVRCDRRDHIAPVLKKLHWLPVKQRVTYKILLLTFRALNGLAPIYIVDMLHRKSKSSASNIGLEVDDQIIFDKSKVADKFNNCFTTVASNLAKSLPAGTGKYCIDQVEKFYTSKGVSEDSFELDPVCEEQVHKLLNGINACKATGLDNIPAKFVTGASEIITSPLTHIINLSLSQGIMPDDLKNARVVPLHKKAVKQMLVTTALFQS